MTNWLALTSLFGVLAAGGIFFAPAFAQNCFETNNCPNDNFLEWSVYPFMYLLGDSALPLVWGLVIGLLYVKTQNSQLTIIVGLFLLTGLATTNSYINTSSNQYYYWGVIIAATAFACSTFYLLKVRVVSPT